MPLINLFIDYGPEGDFEKLYRLIHEAAHEQRQLKASLAAEVREEERARQDALAVEVMERETPVRIPTSALTEEDLDLLMERTLELRSRRERVEDEAHDMILTEEDIGAFLAGAPGEEEWDDPRDYLDVPDQSLRTDESLTIPSRSDDDPDEETDSEPEEAGIPRLSILIQNARYLEENIHRDTPAWEAGYTKGSRDMLVRSERSYNAAMFKKHYFMLYAFVCWVAWIAGDLCDDRPVASKIATESAHHHVHRATQQAVIESLRSTSTPEDLDAVDQ